MSCAADGDGAEVNGDHIKCRLGAAHNGGSHVGQKAVRSVGLHKLCEETVRTAAAQGAHDHEREEFGRDLDRIESGAEEAGDDVDTSCRAEHGHRCNDGDQVGNDANGNLETLFGAFHEFLIYLHAAKCAV